jgi:cholesterol transport system auxiliary component
MKITFANSCLCRSRCAARRTGHFLCSIALAIFLTGCLSRPALVHQDFALQTPAAIVSATGGRGVLAVQPVEVSPLFASHALVYRTGPNTYEADPYAGFLVAPGDALGIPLRAYLANSGVFANVIAVGGPLKASQLLQVQATELYGDFRQPGPPAAVLSLRLVLVNAGGNVLWLKDYARSVTLKKNTAAEVVAGYDRALAEIMTEVAADLKAKPNGNQ